ncbi:MAG TPA: (2Fe-2S)-binding protein [Myxococcota bacterium]|nr:(2Fe-2S)-binding protein [Myxococcota bacterium]HRY96883.1 (2Fe-2S)-binding protein [Myxococcota bacterium]HSA22274.1 (2Fe-2S)-binding protein [Myxococcota bacterium]
MDIHVTVNGRPEVWQAAPGESALELIRRLGYTSVKRGCSQGDCGACTILVDGQAMRACLLVAAQLEGRAVTTAEGLGSLDRPHPLQRAFVDAGAVQCGFCTPGMLLASQALLVETPRPDATAVREALDGNLCRCTGYKKIVEAVLLAAERMA